MPMVLPPNIVADITGDNELSQKDIVYDGSSIYSFKLGPVLTGKTSFKLSSAGCFLVSWTETDSSVGTGLKDIAWNGSILVAVGDAGAISTSPDGSVWTTQTSGTAENLVSVLWSGSQFIAVGDAGTVTTSADGLTWFVLVNQFTTKDLKKLFLGFGRVYVIGVTGTIFYLSGGQWIANNVGVIEDLYGGVQFNSKLVLVGSLGRILLSSDGVTWNSVNSGITTNLYAIAWSGSKLVAVGEGGIALISYDGIIWDSVDASGEDLHAVIYSFGKFYAVGVSGTITQSSYGLRWDFSASSISDDLYAIVPLNNLSLIAVGDAGKTVQSPSAITFCNGFNFTNKPTSNVNPLWAIAVNPNNIMVAVGDGGTILTSVDGNTWIAQTSGTAENLTGVIWNGSLFIVIGDNGTILSSINGIDWEAQDPAGLTDMIKCVCWTGFKFLAITSIAGGNFQTISSYDGITWVLESAVISGTLNSVLWDGVRFVAVGDALIMISPEGINWVQVNSTADSFSSVAFNGSTYVAVSDVGIITSTDAFQGDLLIEALDHFYSVIWADNGFLASTSSSSKIYYRATEGSNWEDTFSGTPLLGLTAIAKFQDVLYVTQDSGDVFKVDETHGSSAIFQQFVGSDNTSYNVEVVLRVLGGDAPMVFVYDENNAKVLVYLDVTSTDGHFRKITGSFTTGSGVGNLTFYLKLDSSIETTSIVEFSSASVVVVGSPVNQLVNGTFTVNYDPEDFMPDSWGVVGKFLAAELLDEQENQIMKVYRHKLLGFSAVSELDDYWFKIELPTSGRNVLSHFDLGGSAFVNINGDKRLAVLMSYLDLDMNSQGVVLYFISTRDRTCKSVSISSLEGSPEKIAAMAVAYTASKTKLLLMEENNSVKTYSIPDSLSGTAVLDSEVALDIGGPPVGASWIPELDSVGFLSNESFLFFGGPMAVIALVKLNNLTELVKAVALPYSDNKGFTFIDRRAFISRPVPPASPAKLGYMIGNVVAPLQVLESWSPSKTVVADGISERNLTLTVVNEFGSAVSSGVVVTMKGFKTSTALLPPVDLFDGQSMQDLAGGKPVTASSEDLGLASRIVDGVKGTKWISSVVPASVTIDLLSDYTIDLVYYLADYQQKYKIELLDSLNNVLNTIDKTGSFSDVSLLQDLDPAIESVRKIKLTVNDTGSPDGAECNALQVFSGSIATQNGTFYIPGYKGVADKDTSVYPFRVIGRTNSDGKINVIYRAGMEGLFSPQQIVYELSL